MFYPVFCLFLKSLKNHRMPAGDTRQQVASQQLWWRWRRPPPYPPSQGTYMKNRWAQRRGEGLAAGVLAVFSGIHYLARLKIHQRLPPFQHMVHLNFTASESQPLSLIWGAAWSTVHQGNARAHGHTQAGEQHEISQMHKGTWIHLIKTTKNKRRRNIHIHWHIQVNYSHDFKKLSNIFHSPGLVKILKSTYYASLLICTNSSATWH